MAIDTQGTKYFNGTSWVEGTRYYFNGTNWVLLDLEPPAAPTGFTVSSSSPTNNNFDLSWTNNDPDDTDTIRVERRVAGSGSGGWSTLTTLAGTATEHTDTTGSGDTEYDYRVRAENDAGNSSYATSLGHPTRPSQPSGGNVVALGETSIRATWNVNSSLGHTQRLQYKKTADVSWTTDALSLSSATESHDVEGLDDGTEYEVRVRAENSDNNKRSSYHNCGSDTTDEAGPSTTEPESFSASQDFGACPASEEVELTWSNGDRSESKVLEWHDGDNNWTQIATPSAAATSARHTTPVHSEMGLDNFYRIRFDTEATHATDTANVTDCPS